MTHFASILLDANQLTERLKVSRQTTGDVASELVERLAFRSYQPVGEIVECTEIGILLMYELELLGVDRDRHDTHTRQLPELLQTYC